MTFTIRHFNGEMQTKYILMTKRNYPLSDVR